MATYPPSSSDSSSDSCEEERYGLLRGPQVGPKPPKRGAIPTTSGGNSGCVNGEGWDGDSMQACPICFEEYARRDMRSLLGCGRHTVCGGCMETHLATLISNVSTATRLTCPAPNCAVLAEVYELESLVDETTYQKYLQFTALESLKKEATAKWCTNPLCGQPIIWDEAVPVVSCPACRTQFCYHCLKAPHVGRQCGENPPPPAFSSSSSKSNLGGNTPTVVNSDPDATYLTWKQQLGAKVKPCPSCKIDTEKNMGCQHMTCSNCGSQCMLNFLLSCFLAFLLSHFYFNNRVLVMFAILSSPPFQ